MLQRTQNNVTVLKQRDTQYIKTKSTDCKTPDFGRALTILIDSDASGVVQVLL